MNPRADDGPGVCCDAPAGPQPLRRGDTGQTSWRVFGSRRSRPARPHCQARESAGVNRTGWIAVPVLIVTLS